MNAQMIEQLLYEEEGQTLDFKRDQYPFAKASEEDKSELLKDILGFANCWRRADAYILIGVKEVQGGRGIVHGIVEHLQDHALQQFVNNLTNRPVQFSYKAAQIDGVQVGVIRIESQKRPIYLKRDYGKLKKGEVYVRRGSSTDPTRPADPDEIAHMGSGQIPLARDASVDVEFADPSREQSLGTHMEWIAENCEMPEVKEIPTLREGRHGSALFGGVLPYLDDPANPDYYRELAHYLFFQKIAKKIRLVVRNLGDEPARDVRLEILIENGQGFGILEWQEVPETPKRTCRPLYASALSNINAGQSSGHAGYVDIEKNAHETKIEIECGSLQPGRNVWTDTFYLGIGQSGPVQIVGKIFAANLTRPIEFSLSIEAVIHTTSMTVEELISLGTQHPE